MDETTAHVPLAGSRLRRGVQVRGDVVVVPTGVAPAARRPGAVR